ncbi:MAG: hypothetical protein ABH885_03445 [Candidatus Omnitrophota bacterium]
MKTKFRAPALALFSLAFILSVSQCGPSYPQTDAGSRDAAYQTVKDYVTSHDTYEYVLSPEGEFVALFNSGAASWINRTLDKAAVRAIQAKLAPDLHIWLNDRGFAPAATRNTQGKTDATHYDAIWVRDNVWVYYALRSDPDRQFDAKSLLLALWDYYATDAQVNRFENIIQDPSLALDKMAMPHVRFDGSSPDLGDVMIDGKPQEWNHRQIDAHGIFFTALGEAVRDNFIDDSALTPGRFKVLSLYPRFLSAIKFYGYEDAGAWEEIERKNTSSIGLATRSLQVWKNVIHNEDPKADTAFAKKFRGLLGDNEALLFAWGSDNLNDLIDKGLYTVRYQLQLGGESPDYPPDDVRFRLADAALIFLIQPSPLDDISEREMRLALTIVETLTRPMGVLRYRHDSYQSGNFWISPPPGNSGAALTDDTSSANAFLSRLKNFIPDTEAQWFFDSLLTLARLRLAEITDNENLRREDLYFAGVHLKRALGQITGDSITADGTIVKAWLMPESINTVVIDGHRHYLPSPIVPLNWSKAALGMALRKYAASLSD